MSRAGGLCVVVANPDRADPEHFGVEHGRRTRCRSAGQATANGGRGPARRARRRRRRVAGAHRRRPDRAPGSGRPVPRARRTGPNARGSDCKIEGKHPRPHRERRHRRQARRLSAAIRRPQGRGLVRPRRCRGLSLCDADRRCSEGRRLGRARARDDDDFRRRQGDGDQCLRRRQPRRRRHKDIARRFCQIRHPLPKPGAAERSPAGKRDGRAVHRHETVSRRRTR